MHLFTEHLLAPSSYPNPVPSLSRIHLPVPPLPAHFPPMTLYSFCTALHQILLQVEPLEDGSSPLDFKQTQERWALMQKTPGNGVGTLSGEWFTASVDLREVEAAKKKVKLEPGRTLLETLAESGQKFGYAKPVAVQTSGVLGEPDEKDVPKLSDVVIRRASLKAQRWKEILKARRTGSFDTTLHPVSVPRVSTGAFTPSFAPTYDSGSAAGMGYDSTLDAMHESARERKYLKESTQHNIPEDGWKGVLAKKPEKPGDKLQGEDEAEVKVEESVDDVLAANAERIEELQEWQEMRVRKGDASWVSDREQAVADELFASLAKLVETSDTPPSALVDAKPGMAHTLAKRLLANRAPIIRGTLDPARPRALHDNSTIRLRAQAAAQINTQAPSALGLNGVAPSPHAAPPKAQQYGQPQMGHSREPPPHTMPNTPRYYPQQQRPAYGSVPAMSPPQGGQQHMGQMRMPYQGAAGSPSFRPQAPNYPRTPMTPGAQNANLGPVQSPMPQTPVGPGSPMQAPMQQQPMQSPMYQRMGPGPSNLRQSYMPGYGSPVQMRMMPQQVSPQVQAAMLGMPIPQQQMTPPGMTPGAMTPGSMTPGGMMQGQMVMQGQGMQSGMVNMGQQVMAPQMSPGMNMGMPMMGNPAVSPQPQQQGQQQMSPAQQQQQLQGGQMLPNMQMQGGQMQGQMGMQGGMSQGMMQGMGQGAMGMMGVPMMSNQMSNQMGNQMGSQMGSQMGNMQGNQMGMPGAPGGAGMSPQQQQQQMQQKQMLQHQQMAQQQQQQMLQQQQQQQMLQQQQHQQMLQQQQMQQMMLNRQQYAQPQ